MHKKNVNKLDKYVLKLRKILYFLVFTPLFDLKSKCKIKKVNYLDLIS